MNNMYMNIKKYRFSLLACTVFFVPVIALAGPVLRSGESVTIGQDQVVDGDFYGAGVAANISGEIQGDAYVVGGTITINAPVTADVAAAGGTVHIHGPVSDDVRIVGGEVTLADTVEGDVFVAGGVLRILSTAVIEGDVLFFGGELAIEGPVEGSVFGKMDRARINAFVGGDVNIRAENNLTLGDRTEVLGAITYRGQQDITRAQNAVVVGDIQTDLVTKERLSLETLLLSIFPLLFAVLTAFLIFRRHLNRAVEDAERSYGKHGLIGLAVFLGVPFVALILMISVLGLIVGMFLLASYIALLFLSWVMTAVLLGSLTMRLFGKGSGVSVLSVIIGALLLQLIMFIPLIGPLAVFAGLLISLGGISLRIYHSAIQS